MSLYEMRQNYSRGILHEKDIDPDPLRQFQHWLDEALQGEFPKWMEVNAMTLSTCNQQGHVTSRMVLLKGLEDEKFWFYTNYDSAKAEQIASNPSVALCFHWPHVERQVRVEGTAEKCSRERSIRYFDTRPRGSRLGALLSKQSSVIESRDVLESRMNELDQQYPDDQIPCPDDWGGYMVTPRRIEFWQGGVSRIHDRISYRRGGSSGDPKWIVERLSP